ncbi:family 88 glycosyl hydrolase [Mycena albidolilacea]|uniref:Family 88 glycosyl hydrolase n=1 Tax=Mycena albidolilacea TaxID=1033008 RepID=A0AAD6ZJW9_9AGAR|nr:family 88 glycosyl hydrolase [Mycena albidolilacea]
MVNPTSLLAICNTTNPFPFSPGFNIAQVAAAAAQLPSHSWEFGTAAEALLELYDPQFSVFAPVDAFPVPTIPKECVESLEYAASKIVFGTGANALSNGEGSVSDPASLGVSAVLLGKTDARYAAAVSHQINYITNIAPRLSNGAISHRVDVAELWADFIYMAPPFLAHAGADAGNLDLLHEAYLQCRLYREILQPPHGPGVWQHIIGPQNQDTGFWATGNAWAAAGMARVLATVMKAPIAASASASWRGTAVSELTHWIKEILDGAMGSAMDGGLLRNYMYLDPNASGSDGARPVFGEISGSCLLAAVAYRMAVLRGSDFGGKYIEWADGIRTTMALYVTSAGIAAPAVNPLNHTDTSPLSTGSPEGNNFVVLMYAAWRDCVVANVCTR